MDVMEHKYGDFVRGKVLRNRDYRRSTDLDFGSTCANHNRKITGKEKRQLVTKDSPDYFSPRGAAFYKKWIKRQPAHLDWVVMGLIGFTVGFVGFLLHQLIDLVMDYKWQMANDLIKEENYSRALLRVVGYSLIFALLGSSMVVSLRVFAAGSGIPELIGFLNATIVRHIFNVKTMAMKFFSCVCAVASGLPVGPEGPMIYLGGLVGAGLGQMELNPPYFRRFRNLKYRRNFISAGIGSGVASAFGAPVGGLLFAMQDLDVSLLCDIRLSGQIFFCTIVATFTTGLFNSVFKNQFNHEGHFGLFKAKRYILFQIDHEVSLHFYVFIPAVILGILGRILGRIFTFINLKIYKFRRYLLRKMRSRRVKNIAHVLEVCSLVVIVGTVSVFLPFPFSCSKYECSFEGSGFDAECLVGHRNALHTERTVSNYACEEGITLMVNGTKYVKGSFNQVATLLFASGEEAIHHLFSRDTHRKFTYGPLLTVLVVYFILACWAAGTAISSGLVVPMLFIGGTYGRIIGKVMVDIFGVHAEGQWAWMDPGAFALIGAASFFGGIPGLTMSLAAIMIEITNDTRCLLLILVAITVSKYVGDLLFNPLFEHCQAKDVISAPAEKQKNTIKDSTNTDGDEDRDRSKRLSGYSQKIGSSTFRNIDPIKLRFLREHCWAEIKEKENIYKEQKVVVQHIDANSFEVKGTDICRNRVIRFLQDLAEKVHFKEYPLNERGMKKQMSMDTTDAIICDVEKKHKCVIQKSIPAEKTKKKTEAPILDGGSIAGTSGASTMKLPYHSMSFVNDKEVKLDSGQRITIVVGDLTQQTVDVIVNTTNEKMDLTANSCGKALLRVAGKELANECQEIGNLQPGNIVSTGPAKLNCKRVYHVRSSSWKNGEGALILRLLIRKCLDQMDKDSLKSIAIPAIGTGNLLYPYREVAKVIFEEVANYLTDNPLLLVDDIRFVVFGDDPKGVEAFLDAVQEIKSKSKHVPKLSFSQNMTFYDGSVRAINPAKLLPGDKGMSITIYCDDSGRIDRAWEEFKKMMNANIKDTTMKDDAITKITTRDLEKIRKLERHFDAEIQMHQSGGYVKIRGHIADISKIQDQILKLLNDIKDKESKVPTIPAYWVKTKDEQKYYQFKLSTDSQEYKDIEAAFRATARNHIISIERIQNKEIYELYNLKRERMIKKYGSIAGKEKMLFHGTSFQNLDKINADGLNRIYAGTNARKYGSGVYFARDAIYSCREVFTPPDFVGFRYMYYANVLVGDYTTGHKDMKVRPPKGSAETYDSVVDDVANPKIYVLFQDYEYYTEYLITFI